MTLTTADKDDIRTIVRQELAKALGSGSSPVEIDVPSALVPFLGASATRDSILRTGAQRAAMAYEAASE